jgi:hypothetical protein
MEAWIVNEVNNGAALPGLYPMNAETKARYAATRSNLQKKETTPWKSISRAPGRRAGRR